MRSVVHAVLAGSLASCIAASTFAGRNVPEFELAYSPTQVVARTGTGAIPEELRERSLELEVQDRRQVPSTVIGSRTDDSDRVFDLVALNDVPEFVETTLADLLRQRGLAILDPNEASASPEEIRDRSAHLVVHLDMFRVTETNQAVGATYVGEVGLSVAVSLPGEAGPLQASSYGDATRYGKKFSNANCNEVLSDALLEATAGFLDDLTTKQIQGGGEAALVGEPAPVVSDNPGPESSRTDPERLLSDLRRLKFSGFSDELILKFLKGRHLTRALTADEAIAIHETLGSEDLLAAVLDLPVSAGQSTPPVSETER